MRRTLNLLLRLGLLATLLDFLHLPLASAAFLAALVLLNALFMHLTLRFSLVRALKVLPLCDRLLRRLISLALTLTVILLVLRAIGLCCEATCPQLPILMGAGLSPLSSHPSSSAPAPNERLEAILAFARLRQAKPPAKPTLQLKEERLEICLPDGTSLCLPARSSDDQRLAMLLAHMLTNSNGRPLFSFERIAKTFGKKAKQNASQHMRALNRAQGSLAKMLISGRPGRHRLTHPVLERSLASFWQRDPLASLEQFHQWLCQHPLPDGLPTPSLEELKRITYLPGNLVTVHRTLNQKLSRSEQSYSLRNGALVAQLFEIVEAQDKALVAAGTAPFPRSGLVSKAACLLEKPSLAHNRVSTALIRVLEPLTSPPDEKEAQALISTVGMDQVAPFHYAALYCCLRMSFGRIATLMGRSKSVIYRSMRNFARAIEDLDLFDPSVHFSGYLGLDEKWLKIPKSYTESERKKGKKWRYAHFAVDLRTGDLLHVDVYEASSSVHTKAFLMSLRARGIRPRVVVTDLWSAYDDILKEVFGQRLIHHHCLFHHLQAVHRQLTKKCGKRWRKSKVLRDFAHQIDAIYQCKDRRTAKTRLKAIEDFRPTLEIHHPEALPLLELLVQRFPKVSNALGSSVIPMTNNITERTIRDFNRHYKDMAGLESIASARVQLRLYRFFYRLTPQRERVNPAERGLCPLELAGFQVRGSPIADYVRHLTEALAGPERGRSPETPASSGTQPVPSAGVHQKAA